MTRSSKLMGPRGHQQVHVSLQPCFPVGVAAILGLSSLASISYVFVYLLRG